MEAGQGGNPRRNVGLVCAVVALAMAAAACADRPKPGEQARRVLERGGSGEQQVRTIPISIASPDTAGEPATEVACPGVQELRAEVDAPRSEIRSLGSAAATPPPAAVFGATVVAATDGQVAVRDDQGTLMLLRVSDSTVIHEEDVRLTPQALKTAMRVQVRLSPEEHQGRRDTAAEIEVL